MNTMQEEESDPEERPYWEGEPAQETWDNEEIPEEELYWEEEPAQEAWDDEEIPDNPFTRACYRALSHLTQPRRDPGETTRWEPLPPGHEPPEEKTGGRTWPKRPGTRRRPSRTPCHPPTTTSDPSWRRRATTYLTAPSSPTRA